MGGGQAPLPKFVNKALNIVFSTFLLYKLVYKNKRLIVSELFVGNLVFVKEMRELKDGFV